MLLTVRRMPPVTQPCTGLVTKARAILEKARQRIPANDQLWCACLLFPFTCRLILLCCRLATVRLELEANSDQVARASLAKGMQYVCCAATLW